MLFNSFAFLVFFPVVMVLYFNSPYAWRWKILLIASCLFYMFAIPSYILILFITILIDYVAAIWIEKTANPTHKKGYLVFSILATCTVLFVFKYFDFFTENMTMVCAYWGVEYPYKPTHWLLPVGLSFHTFQSLSYVIEVYKGRFRAERHFGIYALYVMFFPQLVAGPIERPQNILPQLRQSHDFSYESAVSGLRLMLEGFVKKVVIADTLAVWPIALYDLTHITQSPSTVLISIFCFSIQIYCDFSGYSDIARGSARMMGYQLMQNFDNPYLSPSIATFWRRWHISLSFWLRDYIYIPLGGSKKGVFRQHIHLWIVFIVSGLWHGASWTFVFWGFLHGGFLSIEKVAKGWIDKMVSPSLRQTFALKILSTLCTFVAVTVAWIFFRAHSFTQALGVLSQAAQFSFANVPTELSIVNKFDIVKTIIALSLFVFGLMPLFLKVRRTTFYLFVLLLIVLFLGKNDNISFIYFQF